jgi:hypothetical protein
MWKCNNCREDNEDNFDMCWSCGADKKGALNKDFDTSESVQESTYNEKGVIEFKKSYETATLIAQLTSAIGWITIVAGIIVTFTGSMIQGMQLIPILAGFIVGLPLILAGQVTLAIVDNANNTKEMLEIMKGNEN